MSMSPAIGIDLGTTYSRVGYRNDNDQVVIIATIPSCIVFTDSGPLIGVVASEDPSHTCISGVKRLIGHTVAGVQRWPFTVNPGRENRPVIFVTSRGETKQFAPEEITAMLLMRLKELAEEHLGCEVKHAVLTVPARFDDSQCQATLDAAAFANITVLRLLSDPVAAVIGYNDPPSLSERWHNMLVFDLGGGTFDVSIVMVKKDKIEVLASVGDSRFGGMDFDDLLLGHCTSLFHEETSIEIAQHPEALLRLRSHCEEAKKVLSGISFATIEIESLLPNINFTVTISRDKFVELSKDLIVKCHDLLLACLEDAKMPYLHGVLLLGSSSKMPIIKELVSNVIETNYKDIERSLCKFINLDRNAPVSHSDLSPVALSDPGSALGDAVVVGAAIEAARLRGMEILCGTPFSLGIMSPEIGKDPICIEVPRDTPCPVRIERPLDTSSMSVGYFFYTPDRSDAGQPQTEYYKVMGTFKLPGMIRDSQPERYTFMTVTFKLDAIGPLKISTYHTRTQEVKNIKVTRPACLSKDEARVAMKSTSKLREERGKDGGSSSSSHLVKGDGSSSRLVKGDGSGSSWRFLSRIMPK